MRAGLGRIAILPLLACLIALPIDAAAARTSPSPDAEPVPSTEPAPYVVAIDPGHGGSPDDNHPDVLYDPGSTANGLVEKDLTLQTAQIVRDMLQEDLARVVLTRDHDVFVDISDRMASAIAAGAKLFVSIHFNDNGDPSVGGSEVLYPNDGSAAFAKVLSDQLTARLASYGVTSQGTVLFPDLWQHATMPAATVEGAYMSNDREAGLLKQPEVLHTIALAIAQGIEAQDPELLKRKAQILAWRAEQERTPAVVVQLRKLSSWPTLAGFLTLIASIIFVLRRPLLHFVFPPPTRRARTPGRRRGSRRKVRDLPDVVYPRRKAR